MIVEEIEVQELSQATLIGSTPGPDNSDTDTLAAYDSVEGRSLRQQGLILKIDFVIPQRVTVGCLDEWIVALEQPSPAPTWRETVRLDSDDDRIRYWITSCLNLTQSILLILRIPSLDPLSILHCEKRAPSDSKWRATVRLPCPDSAFRPNIVRTINQVLALAVWASDTSPDRDNKQRFYDTIRDKILTPQRAVTALGKSTIEILKVAYQQDIPFLSLGRGVYQLGWGAKAITIDRSSTRGDSAMSPRMTTNKFLCTKILAMAGLPSSTHRAVRDVGSALQTGRTLGWPVVIKPVDGERGEGVSVDVDEANLPEAFEYAHRNSKNQTVLVEKQVKGVCYRLFIAHGDLLYAVKRLPIGVYGDSKRTIGELVSDAVDREQCRPPWKRIPIQPIDPKALAVLESNNLTEHSIPEDGQFVPLRPIETTASGGVDIDVTPYVHAENIRAAVHAAQITGLEVAGVDIITTDISCPWHETGAVINEVNYAPLLGGGKISRSYIATYLDRLLDGDGRIPLELYIGGDAAFIAARERGAELAKKFPGLTITSATHTESSEGQTIPMALTGLGRRAQALIMRESVDALILVVQDDELLRQDLTLDNFDQIVHIDDQLQSLTPDQSLVPVESIKTLISALSERKKRT